MLVTIKIKCENGCSFNLKQIYSSLSLQSLIEGQWINSYEIYCPDCGSGVMLFLETDREKDDLIKRIEKLEETVKRLTSPEENYIEVVQL